MAISINDVKSGIGLMVEGQLYVVESYNHVKPGKGSAFVRIRLRNVKTELVLERTFKSSESLDDVELEERRMQYTYNADGKYHFMDQETYDEIVVSQAVVGDGVDFLQENGTVTGLFNGHEVLKVLLPNFIVTEVLETEPGVKGDTKTSSTKSAKIDTGTTVQVPLFINKGDWLKIDTRDRAYVERVQK